MSVDFSQIRNILSQKPDATHQRGIFIFAGKHDWQKENIEKIVNGYQENSLWVGKESAPGLIPFISAKQAHSWLGREKQVVIFDATESFDVDAFAAISGIVVGGGLFILLMPARDKWGEVYTSYFGQRLLKSIDSNSDINIISQNSAHNDYRLHNELNRPVQNYDSPFLSIDQQCAVEKIEEQVSNNSNTPVVIISDRGRGKSAALGLAAARLLQNGIKTIAITAPRLRATDIIFKHAAMLLRGAEVTRGCVKYNQGVIRFYSPDQLVQENIKADVLLVDEAAAIPVPLLTSFLLHFPQCVFATTVHGYEGTGRGFALRFNKILTQQYPQWIRLQMQTPVRWNENDALERWMFDLLCLDAELADSSAFSLADKNRLEYRELSQAELANNEPLLREIFSLLVLAHYRTRPGDLKKLLDDTSLTIYIALNNQHVIAVAMVIREGLFSDALSSAVYRGERRPQGHLLAQALTYHCGVEHAATLEYARVMRIAVHPEFQHRGIGSELLQFIITCEQQNGRDAVGTSFGMNIPLLNFWKGLKFDVVRIGFTREQTSGEHAAIMLLPFTPRGRNIHHEARLRFCQQLSFWLNDVLRDLTDEIKQSLCCNDNASFELSAYEKKDLQSFVNRSRNYELCISALNKLVQQTQQYINQGDFPEQFRLLIEAKVMQQKSWDELVRVFDFEGKDDARRHFYQAIVFLLTTVQVDFIPTDTPQTLQTSSPEQA